MTKFTIEIEIGNDAMQTGQDVIAALQALDVLDWSETLSDISDNVKGARGQILDTNGNRIGEWRVD